MLSLTPLLAQAIVDRTMGIIDFNVNVMDAYGVIIGSKDPSRIGILHEGGVLAITQARVIHIDDTMTAQLHGVRPGVNVPIWADGQIVGAVGLTGAPAEVQPYAELVRTIAEMILEQTRLVQLLEHDSRLKEELTLTLTREMPPTPNTENWARHLGIDLKQPRVAIVVKIDSHSLDADDTAHKLQHLRNLLIASERNTLVASTSLTELIVLRPALDSQGRWNPERHLQSLEALQKRAQHDYHLIFYMALGHYFSGIDSLVRSVQTAQTTFSVGMLRTPKKKVFSYHELTLPVLLDRLRDSWQAAELSRPLQQLAEYDKDNQLRNTLLCWFQNDTRSTPTAESLGIHRNTLDYRLNRIAEICGMSLSTLDARLHLYIALQLGASLHS